MKRSGLLVATVASSMVIGFSVSAASVDEPPPPPWVDANGLLDGSQLPSFLPVLDSNGEYVGLVESAALLAPPTVEPLPVRQDALSEIPSPPDEVVGHDPPQQLPVYNGNEEVVGYVIDGIGFVPTHMGINVNP